MNLEEKKQTAKQYPTRIYILYNENGISQISDYCYMEKSGYVEIPIGKLFEKYKGTEDIKYLSLLVVNGDHMDHMLYKEDEV